MAGCADPNPSPLELPTEPNDARVLESNWTMIMTLGVPAVSVPVQPDGNWFEFQVRSLPRLEARATWVCGSGPACDMALVLTPPDGGDDIVTMGPSPQTIVVDAPRSGEWLVGIAPHSYLSAGYDVRGTLRVTKA